MERKRISQKRNNQVVHSAALFFFCQVPLCTTGLNQFIETANAITNALSLTSDQGVQRVAAEVLNRGDQVLETCSASHGF